MNEDIIQDLLPNEGDSSDNLSFSDLQYVDDLLATKLDQLLNDKSKLRETRLKKMNSS